MLGISNQYTDNKFSEYHHEYFMSLLLYIFSLLPRDYKGLILHRSMLVISDKKGKVW